MKNILFATLALFGLTGTSPDSVSLELTSTAPEKGVIRLAVFTDAESLAQENPTAGQVIELTKEDLPLQLSINDLPAGEFAVAAYHDLNNDGKLNKNLFGVPSEPYAFSGVPASKWRAPEWKEIVVLEDKRTEQIALDLKFWKEQ